MATPQTLMKVWINEPIPVDFYSDKEKEVQKLINEKTTDGIITYSPLDKEKEWTSVDYEEITPFTWKWIDFELPKPDGTLTKINLRRPHWWLKEIGADSVGKKVYLNMPELGSQGWATVIAIRVNQLDTRFWDENRDGDYVSRPITGKFIHESNDVYNLHFGDNAKPLGVTGSHPIWSIDRNDWIGATDLKIGEKVKTQEGELTLVSKEKIEGKHKVYNLEIYKDHNFLVSTDKILVHNSCIDDLTKVVGNKSANYGFYRVTLKNGDVYIGKGPLQRARNSARRESGTSDYSNVESLEWWESASENNSYMMEYRLLEVERGKGTNILNRIESKGKKLNDTNVPDEF